MPAPATSAAMTFPAQFSSDREGGRQDQPIGMSMDVSHPQDVVALLRHALALCLAGELTRADALCTECRMLSVARDDAWGLSHALWILGLIRWQQRDFGQAIRHAVASGRTGRHVHERLAVARAHELLAWIATTTGVYERAAELLGVSTEAWRFVPADLGPSTWEMEWREHCTAHIRHGLGEDGFQAAMRRGAEVHHVGALTDAWEELLAPSTTLPAAVQAVRPLTERQYQVALLVAEGRSDREIADKLVVSQRTAEGHVANILARLAFTSRAQIAAWIAIDRRDHTGSSAQTTVPTGESRGTPDGMSSTSRAGLPSRREAKRLPT
jgi:non-specific serine/threonine protein kinase